LFHGKGQGIGFDAKIVVLCFDLELIKDSRTKPGDKKLPDSGTAHGPHGKEPAIPAIKFSQEADPLGIGGPDGEGNPGDALDGFKMSPKVFIKFKVIAFIEKAEIHIPKGGKKAVWIFGLPKVPIREGETETIRERPGLSFQADFKDPTGMDARHIQRLFPY
jgi:hypothetical protein